MMRSLIKIFMVVSGLGILVTLLFHLDREWIRPEGPIEFRSETCRFPSSLIVGIEGELTVKIHNGRHQTVRLIGGVQACGPDGCATIRGLPLEIPPDKDQDLVVSFKPTAAGSFLYEGEIYTDQPTQPSILLKLSGQAIGP